MFVQRASDLMISHLQLSALALGLMLIICPPGQAETIELGITGALIPTACTPTLGGGGVIDYGLIAAEMLSATAFTALPVKQISFSITCDAPAQIAIKALNGRVGSLAGPTETGWNGVALNPVPLFGATGVPVVGLGLDDTRKIGGYALRAVSGTFIADGVAVDNLFRRTTGAVPTSWIKDTINGTLYTSFGTDTIFKTWASIGSLTPLAFEVLSGTLELQAYINRGSALDFSHPIILDGLTTIEIVYL